MPPPATPEKTKQKKRRVYQKYPVNDTVGRYLAGVQAFDAARQEQKDQRTVEGQRDTSPERSPSPSPDPTPDQTEILNSYRDSHRVPGINPYTGGPGLIFKPTGEPVDYRSPYMDIVYGKKTIATSSTPLNPDDDLDMAQDEGAERHSSPAQGTTAFGSSPITNRSPSADTWDTQQTPAHSRSPSLGTMASRPSPIAQPSGPPNTFGYSMLPPPAPSMLPSNTPLNPGSSGSQAHQFPAQGQNPFTSTPEGRRQSSLTRRRTPKKTRNNQQSMQEHFQLPASPFFPNVPGNTRNGALDAPHFTSTHQPTTTQGESVRQAPNIPHSALPQISHQDHYGPGNASQMGVQAQPSPSDGAMRPAPVMQRNPFRDTRYQQNQHGAMSPPMLSQMGHFPPQNQHGNAHAMARPYGAHWPHPSQLAPDGLSRISLQGTPSSQHHQNRPVPGHPEGWMSMNRQWNAQLVRPGPPQRYGTPSHALPMPQIFPGPNHTDDRFNHRQSNLSATAPTFVMPTQGQPTLGVANQGGHVGPL